MREGEEANNKKGDGGDSDEEGEGGKILDFNESLMMDAYNS